MDSILIIDDEKPITNILTSILEDEGYHVYTANTGEAGLDILKKNRVSLVFLDLWLPKIGGMDILTIIKEEILSPEVIIISGHANVDIAVQAIKKGAYDCIEKPLDLSRIISLTKKSITKYNDKIKSNSIKINSIHDSKLIGECDSIIKIKNLIKQISDSDSRVIILGDNGTGKEVIAKEIHLNSNRRNKPYIEVNCAAIPDNLIESELFGHEKGSFTGAIESRMGKFEAAHGGTLFLDEIADMSLVAQAKVLRAIQEQKFHRVGSDKLIDVDIRIISATNKKISEEIKSGLFREDLYFRLSVIPIEIPCLKDRGDDITLLAKYFLICFNKEHNTSKYIVDSSYELLKKHDWPGNVRELKNFIERVCIISDFDEIDLINFIDFNTEEDIIDESMDGFLNLPLGKAKDEFEKKLIYSKLSKTNGNITKAAEELGIYPSNLHNKIKKYGIDIKK